MCQYNLNLELNSLRKTKAIISKPLLPFINFFMKMVFRLTSDSEVSVKTYTVQGYKNADKLNIDVNKLVIGGDSAGGNLAIGVTMLAIRCVSWV